MIKVLFPVLALVLATGTVQAQNVRYQPQAAGNDNTHYGWADVLRVDPVYGVTRTEVPQQQCYEQPVIQREGGNTTAGTVLGAVIGGVLGSAVGKGDGRKVATVAGALAGGAVGNRSTQGRDVESVQTRCRDVSTVSERRSVTGYDVEYRYRGGVYMSRLNYDPGERLRVRISVEPAD